MAFGQQNGRPATARQLRTLEELLGSAGYSGFRDARGPLGFTQRQAGGKFTTDEADAYIEQLEAEAEAEAGGGDGDVSPTAAEASAGPRAGNARQATPVPKVPAGVAKGTATPLAGTTATERREARQGALVRDLPAKVLARELERRGWILIPPEDLTAADPTAPGPEA